MLTWDLFEDCEGCPDGMYDDRLRGLRLSVERGQVITYMDRDVMERERAAGHVAGLWAYDWGDFPDVAEFNGSWEMNDGR